MLDIDFLLNKKRQQTIDAANSPMPTLPIGGKETVKCKSRIEAYMEDITYEKKLTGGPDTPVLTSIRMCKCDKHSVNKG